MEPIVHAIIPLMFLLAVFPKLDKKYVFLLLPIVWIIDLDLYIPGDLHRYLFGNIFFVFLLAGIAYWAWDKKAFFVAMYYGVAHLLLDSFYGGTAWLWPLWDKTILLVASVKSNGEWAFDLGIRTMSREEFLALVEGVQYAEYITETGVLFLILLGILLVAKYRKEIVKKFKK
jgi:hypothetical protein